MPKRAICPILVGMRAFQETLKPNLRGRDFVVGDLHGMFDCLREALVDVRFDPTRDRLISVGDLVDRGGDSLMCLGLLMNPWFCGVRGNHEQMMIDSMRGGDRDLWRRNGGEWADSYNKRALRRIAARASLMPHVITIETRSGGRIGITHAECPVDDWDDIGAADKDKALKKSLVWGRSVLEAGRPVMTRNVDLTIHGHSPIDAPRRLGNALFIDTGCCYDGNLTLMDINDALTFGVADEDIRAVG